MTESRQVVIVGSGPAGLTAAIYASRAQLSPLVIEGEPSSTSDQPGGQLMLTTEVENYPGFVDGIMGPELMQAFREQAARFGAEYLTAKVSRVDLSSRPFGLWVGDPDAEEPHLRGRRPDHRHRGPVADAQSAQRGAAARLRRVHLRHLRRILLPGEGDRRGRRGRLRPRGGPLPHPVRRQGHRHPPAGRAAGVQGHAAAGLRQPEDHLPWNTSVIDVLGDTKVTGVRVRDNLSEEESEIDLSGLFVAIGHQPNTSLFKGQIEMEENGYVRTFDGTRTNVDGVFACGDVQDHRYRQAITAAGSGCMAAIDVERWLEDQQAAH